LYPVRILSIDGGGIRGIIPLKILDYIEKKTGKPIHQLFNVIGGTSTGGIIALGLNSFKRDTKEVYKADDLMDFYTKDAKQLFCPNRLSFGGFVSSMYKAQSIESYLKDKFGATTLLNELPTDCDVTVYSYDLLKNEPFYFNNREERSVNPRFVWQAARATSAAPTFFPALELKDGESLLSLIDGGMYINNPTLNLLIRARYLYPKIDKKNQLLVSIGTGEFNPPKGYLKAKGKLSWAASLFDVTSMGTSSEAAYQTAELLERLDPQVLHKDDEWEKRYYRFQKKFDKNIPMDGISSQQLATLKKLGDELVKEQQEDLDGLCANLIKSIKSEVQISSS
jgi:patatin-like phospholipase/acyl hydrolase